MGTIKKYVYEAKRTQLEKPTEPKHFFNSNGIVAVFAESEEEALKKATAAMLQKYYWSGYLMGDLKLTHVFDLPVDWSYGYDDDRKMGETADIGIDSLLGKNIYPMKKPETQEEKDLWLSGNHKLR